MSQEMGNIHMPCTNLHGHNAVRGALGGFCTDSGATTLGLAQIRVTDCLPV